MQNSTSPLARDTSIPNDQTTDKELLALRRQRRVQMEVHEKMALRQAILEEQRRNDSKSLNDGINPLRYNGVGFKLGTPPKKIPHLRGKL